MEFLENLQNLSVDDEISLDELENVSGGVRHLRLKIAAIALLGAPLLSSAAANTASAELPFYNELSRKSPKAKLERDVAKFRIKNASFKNLKNTSTTAGIIKNLKADREKLIGETSDDLKLKLNLALDPVITVLNKITLPDDDKEILEAKNIEQLKKSAEVSDSLLNTLQPEIDNAIQEEGKKKKQKKFYKIISETIQREINEKLGTLDFNEGKKFIDISTTVKIELQIKTMQHVLYGEYNDKAVLNGGGHSKETLEILNKICGEKLKEDATNNPFKEKFIREVLRGDATKVYTIEKEFSNGVKSCKFKDSLEGIDKDKCIFPESWTNQTIIKAIKLCVSAGKEYSGSKDDAIVFIAKVNGVCMLVATGKEIKDSVTTYTVRSAYPLDAQEPDGTGKYTFTDPKDNSKKITDEIIEITM